MSIPQSKGRMSAQWKQVGLVPADEKHSPPHPPLIRFAPIISVLSRGVWCHAAVKGGGARLDGAQEEGQAQAVKSALVKESDLHFKTRL